MIDLINLRKIANRDIQMQFVTSLIGPEAIIELLNRIEAAENKLKQRDLGKAYWHTRYKQCYEVAFADLSKLQDKLDKTELRLEAAEKVCDGAVSYCNPDDDDVCYLDFVEIVERWQQEVS